MSDEQNEHAPETEPTERGPANVDVFPDLGGRWGRFRAGWPYTPEIHFARPRLPHLSPTLVRGIAVTVGAVLALGSAGVAYATYDYHQQYRGRILPGAVIGTVDVGGMTYRQAVAAVKTATKPRLDAPFTLRWRDKTWSMTKRDLGARGDVTATVGRALAASNETSFLNKAQMRVLGGSGWFEDRVPIVYPNRALSGFLRGMASTFNKDAKDATVDYSTGWVEVVKEQAGRKLRVVDTHKAVSKALHRGSTGASLEVKTVEPTVTENKFDEVLLLRIGENKLYYYQDGVITHEWTVASGLPEYPTPTGIYEIELKRYMPTWVNPDPEGWGADMPASIPPGPGNPLGVRALNWTAPAIRFHGTSATYSLGYNASHGCVRMSSEDVIQLYDLVDVGTPIVSTIVAPLRPLYSSAPDPTVVSPN